MLTKSRQTNKQYVIANTHFVDKKERKKEIDVKHEGTRIFVSVWAPNIFLSPRSFGI